jgi:hypothetical protein
MVIPGDVNDENLTGPGQGIGLASAEGALPAWISRNQFWRSAPDIRFEDLHFFSFPFHNFAPFLTTLSSSISA